MNYVYIFQGLNVTNSSFRTIDGTAYPSNWCRYASNSELSSIGVVKLLEVYPELNEGEQYDGTYTDDLINLTRTYNKTTI